MNISQNLIPDAAFRSIIESFASSYNWFSTITCISVPNSNIYSLKGIELFPNLELLEVSYNHIACLDLSQNKKLKELYICENDMQDLQLADNVILKRLHCYGNELPVDMAIKALRIVNNKKDLIMGKSIIYNKGSKNKSHTKNTINYTL